MSGDLPFHSFDGGYGVVRGSPRSMRSIHSETAMSDGHDTADYNLETTVPINFGSPHELYLFDTPPGVTSSPITYFLDYQQGNQQLNPETMFPELEMQSTYNTYRLPDVINPSLWSNPGAAQSIASMPTTEAASLATMTLRRGNRCGGNCEGKFDGEHRCMRDRGGVSVLCRAKGCESVLTTRGRFNRHWNTKHRNGDSKQKISCPVVGCGRVGDNGFARQDNLRQHRRNVHNEIIPKERRRSMGATR